MTRSLSLLCGVAVLVVSACSSERVNSSPGPGAPLHACVERPGELPRAPTGKLPCELLPPGLSLE
jgi:hypothetical protein